MTVWAAETGADGEVIREYDDTPGWLRADRGHHRPSGHPAAAAGCRRRAHLRRVRGPRRRHRRRSDPAGQGSPRGPGRPGQDRGDPAADRAGPWRAVRARRAAAVLRPACPQGVPRTVGDAVAHPSQPGAKLFALEVPEIASGAVEIAAIAREAGHRSKIAVISHQSGVNAKGACIGPMGSRVRNVMTELHGEKIDIVDYSPDPAEFVAHALSPARVSRVIVVDAQARAAQVIVPDYQLLAGDRQGGAERPAGRPADRLAHRHPAGQPWRCRADGHRASRRPGRAQAASRRPGGWPGGRGAGGGARRDAGGSGGAGGRVADRPGAVPAATAGGAVGDGGDGPGTMPGAADAPAL